MKNRSGSYKKVLFSSEDLKELSQNDLIPLMELVKVYESKKLSDCDFTTLYLLFFIRLKSPVNYIQQKNKKFTFDPDHKKLLQLIPDSFQLSPWEKEKLAQISGPDLFLNFNLKGIPLSVNRAMFNWYQKNWNIVLSFSVPTSDELLILQAQNSRVLTLIVDPKKIAKLILGVRDALSFALHDLMHADQFFNNPISQKGQLGFYNFILEFQKNEKLKILKINNSIFQNDYEYVISDMNAYIIHLLKSLKSCFTKIDAEETLFQLLQEALMPKTIVDLIKKINKVELTIEEELEIKNYFESNQEILR